MVNCDSCLNSRPIMSENGYHSICCLSEKKATGVLINWKIFYFIPVLLSFLRRMMMIYTPIIDDFQIRDVVYLDSHIDEHPRKFDIVKYYNTEPTEVYVVETDKKEIKDRFCYTVAWLEWNSHESGFDFKSCGLRWLECEPSEEVIKMILGFSEMMSHCIRWEEENECSN